MLICLNWPYFYHILKTNPVTSSVLNLIPAGKSYNDTFFALLAVNLKWVGVFLHQFFTINALGVI